MGNIYFFLFSNIIGPPVVTANESFSFAFSLTTGIIKKLLKITRNKRKKYNMIVMLANSKFSSIESLISQALIDSEISHIFIQYATIINEEETFEKMKEDIRLMKSRKIDAEKDELNEEGERKNWNQKHNLTN